MRREPPALSAVPAAPGRGTPWLLPDGGGVEGISVREMGEANAAFKLRAA